MTIDLDATTILTAVSVLIGLSLLSGNWIVAAVKRAYGGLAAIPWGVVPWRKLIGCLLVAIGIVPVASQLIDVGPPDRPRDAVAEAISQYEDLFRQTAGDAAWRLESGQLTTDTDTREFLAAANRKAREAAFQPLAEAEEEALNPWTAAKHAEILREYAK